MDINKEDLEKLRSIKGSLNAKQVKEYENAYEHITKMSKSYFGYIALAIILMCGGIFLFLPGALGKGNYWYLVAVVTLGAAVFLFYYAVKIWLKLKEINDTCKGSVEVYKKNLGEKIISAVNKNGNFQLLLKYYDANHEIEKNINKFSAVILAASGFSDIDIRNAANAATTTAPLKPVNKDSALVGGAVSGLFGAGAGISAAIKTEADNARSQMAYQESLQKYNEYTSSAAYLKGMSTAQKLKEKKKAEMELDDCKLELVKRLINDSRI